MIRTITGVVAAALACAACGDAAGNIRESGDRLLAVGEVDRAIAEYKLADREKGGDPETLVRLGHAYALQGDVDGAREYLDALLEIDESRQPQVAAELISLAYEARERGVYENMARALDPLLQRGPGFVPAELRLDLARHRFEDGDYSQALALLLSVLEDGGEVDPEVHFLAARAYEELGGCRRALPRYEAYLGAANRGDASYETAQYGYGNCLFQVADDDRANGRPGQALARLEQVVRLGQPRHQMDNAHFLRGEMLLALGRTDEALSAYRRVLELNPARTGPLVRRAEERIRQIRFGF